MRCDDVRENLVAYLDGEVTPDERDRIESHLAGCEACGRERTALDTTGDLLSLIGGRVEGAPDLTERLLGADGDVDTWCRHIRRELVAFVDDELGEREARPVRDHLEDCAECQEEEDALRRTEAALPVWVVPEREIDLVTEVLGPRPATTGRLFRFASIAAAACVLVIAGLLAFRSGDAPVTDMTKSIMDILEEDPDLLEMAEDLDWLESVTEEELALLNGKGG